jgi:hypothetical protein
MSVENALLVVHSLLENGELARYAITGAVAALFYIQPTLTEDVDILVEVSAFDNLASGLLLSTRLDAALASRGYTERKDVGIVVEGWPVQFIPAVTKVDIACLEAASLEVFMSAEGPSVWVLRPEYIIAKALEIARPKDLQRIEAFLTQSAVDLDKLKKVIMDLNLKLQWQDFCRRVNRSDILELNDDA